jgi:TolB-like protein
MRTDRAWTEEVSGRVSPVRRALGRAAAAGVALALTAALGVSCAGPKKLTEQSEKALAQGEVDRAYDKARSALRKAPDNERARQALAAAADRKIVAIKERIRAVAGAKDTLSAAGHCLEMDSFRREIAEYRVAPPPDPGFDRDAARIRHAAARTLTANADEALRSGRARDAYGALERARAFEAAYPGLDRRLEEAYAQAIHRIAVLPFQNQTDARGLGRELTELVQTQVKRGLNPRNFPFSVVLPSDEVASRVTLAEAERLNARSAVALGRDLDADYVVTGRVYGLGTETTTDTWHPTVYYRHAEAGSDGVSVEQYSERRIDVVVRTRRVAVRTEYEIRSTADGAVVARRSDPWKATARVIHTGRPDRGGPKDYFLMPPSMKKANPREYETREREWKNHCGSWDLEDLLTRAGKEPRRSYGSSMRSEFYSDTDDLAVVALRDAWKPVLDAVRRVER